MMMIRQLQASDVVAYRALMMRAYSEPGDAFTSTAQERSAKPLTWWHDRVVHPQNLSVGFGAFLQSTETFDSTIQTKLVGSVAIEFSERTKTLHKADLVGMYVAPEARGLGAGCGLVKAVLDYARGRKTIRSVVLTATQGNDAAITLYQSMGFQQYGLEPFAVLGSNGFKAKVHMQALINE
jgi:ribosomal protein S18 acetylase RimI-like enzyme